MARWEDTRPTMPDERCQPLLARLYARTPTHDPAVGAGSDLAELLEALRLFGESKQRIIELRSAMIRAVTDEGGGMLAFLAPGVQAGLAAAPADPGRTDEDVVHGLASVVSDVNAQVGSLPFVRLQLMLASAVEACRHLLAGASPEPLLPPAP